MKSVYGATLAGLVLAGAGLVLAQAAQDYPHAYPRDGATKLLENERVIVWEVTWPNGVPQPYHRHRYDMTGVFLRWGPLRVTRPDGTFTISEVPFEIPWVFLQGKGVTHKEEGIGTPGTPERHSIMIDMKEFAAPPFEPRTDIPLAFPRDEARAALVRSRVTVWDYTWQTGQEVPLHVHDKDTVAVFLEGGTILTTDENGREERMEVTYKDVRFWPRGGAHTEEAVSGSPRAMIYELQN